MHVFVTPLRVSSSGTKSSAANVVAYLEGSSEPTKRLKAPGSGASGADAGASYPGAIGGSASGIGGYFADSAEQSGRWIGAGASPEHFDLGKVVDGTGFARALVGQHPVTGEQLIEATGSAGRTGRRREPLPTGDAPVSVSEAAAHAGVSRRYLSRVVAQTIEVRRKQDLGEVAELPSAFLDSTQIDDKPRQIEREELARFIEHRDQPKVVLGYDVTVSVPKSVSILWAVGDAETKVEIDEALDAATGAALSYLEREAFHVREKRGRRKAHGMLAGAYRHQTNRALEPQLHDHVVIANMAFTREGSARTVDARGLLAHGKTAGALAGAELRAQLTRRLGVAWGEMHKGSADLVGIERPVIDAMSSRRSEVLAAAAEMGTSTPQGRAMAALVTRPGKDVSVEATELQQSWRTQLAELGLEAEQLATILGQQSEPVRFELVDQQHLHEHLGGTRGVTEQKAVFDRRDVIQAIAAFAGDRLDANAVEDAADHWLHVDAVIPLYTTDLGERTIGRVGKVALLPDEQRYTTVDMLNIEAAVTDAHLRRLNKGLGRVAPNVVEAAINNMAASDGIQLGADQAATVRAITTSGDQFQAVVGRAGAGKTTAMKAAVNAWIHDGYEVIGLAPTATAAKQLAADCSIECHTVAWLITFIESNDTNLAANTVVLIDEASMLSNRDLAKLYNFAQNSNAIVRTVGDPLQHQSVEAGGLWAHLTERFAEHTPSLETNRRQRRESMIEVRLALDDYRTGLIDRALHRLDDDDRIITTASWTELLDQMSADWYVDHRRTLEHGALPSQMIADRNSDRHELNARAQNWLRQDATLGKPVAIGRAEFHVGDRVVAQAINRKLRPKGADNHDHVINGSLGTVIEIDNSDEPDLLVDFDGLGPIRVPHDFAADEIGPGRGGGIAPAYAVTSHKAQGQTFASANVLSAPGAIGQAGGYVGLTRGRDDLRLYTIDPANLSDPPELPTLPDQREALTALIASLQDDRSGVLATVADAEAHRVAQILSDDKRQSAATERTGRRAVAIDESRVRQDGIRKPDQRTVYALGPRPPTPGADRRTWDNAVGAVAVYRHRWSVTGTTLGGTPPPPKRNTPAAQRKEFKRVEAATRAAAVEHLVRQPLHDVLQEHRLVEHLAAAVDTGDRDGLRHELVAAKTARRQAAKNERAAVSEFGREPTEPLRIAMHQARLTTRRATERVAVTERAIAALKGPLEQNPVNERHSVINDAMSRRIADAAASAQGYLREALGPRPPKGPDRSRWTEAATTIETYRHWHLQRSPDDGPLAASGAAAAIGPEPKRPAARAAAARAIAAYRRQAKGHRQQPPRIER